MHMLMQMVSLDILIHRTCNKSSQCTSFQAYVLQATCGVIEEQGAKQAFSLHFTFEVILHSLIISTKISISSHVHQALKQHLQQNLLKGKLKICSR